MEAMLLKYGVANGVKVVANSLYPTTDYNATKQILDPLSSLIRLSLLSFKERGCKISISNNRIYFQPQNISQGPVRWIYGDNRNDLHNLYNPIEHAVLWYDPKTNEDIANIFTYSIKGLEKLKNSYVNKDCKFGDSNLVCHSINHYINIINLRLKNGDVISTIQDNEITNLKYLWNKDEIMVVNTLLNIASHKKDNKEDFKYLIHSIEAILDGKDTLIKTIL